MTFFNLIKLIDTRMTLFQRIKLIDIRMTLFKVTRARFGHLHGKKSKLSLQV